MCPEGSTKAGFRWTRSSLGSEPVMVLAAGIPASSGLLVFHSKTRHEIGQGRAIDQVGLQGNEQELADLQEESAQHRRGHSGPAAVR